MFLLNKNLSEACFVTTSLLCEISTGLGNIAGLVIFMWLTGTLGKSSIIVCLNSTPSGSGTHAIYKPFLMASAMTLCFPFMHWKNILKLDNSIPQLFTVLFSVLPAKNFLKG